MRGLLRQVHAWLAWAFVAAIVFQVFLAGQAIPQLGGNNDFGSHAGFGWLIGLLALLQLVLAVAAGVGRRRIGISAGLFGLFIVQMSLPYMDTEAGLPAVAALHPVNALVMFGISFWYARQVWRERSGAPALA